MCDLLSWECRVVGPFASGVCLLLGEADLETCVGFLVGSTSACPLVGGAESCLSLQWAVLCQQVCLQMAVDSGRF